MDTHPMTDNRIEGATEFDFTADYFDSRDVIARIEYLVGEWEGNTEESFYDYPAMNTDDYQAGGLTEEEAEELYDLLALQEAATDYIPDWKYGETFISDDYFQEYAEELAHDIGAINPKASWPLNRIDWEAAADDLREDYASFMLRGTTYWAR